MNRLSSDNLFHFTRSFSVLKSILKKGIRHSLSEEMLPGRKEMQQNYVACFCDIKFKESTEHRKCYGDYAVALTKEWGIKNGITPVTYIHQNSVAFSSKAKALKNKYRSIFKNFDYANPQASLSNAYRRYLIFSILEKRLQVTLLDPIKALDNPIIRNEYQKIYKEVWDFYQKLKSIGLANQFVEYIDSLCFNLSKVSDELENRDWLVRSYKDEFTCPNSSETFEKVLYDEKEWRSVKDSSQLKIDFDSKEYDRSYERGYLPEKYNLTFDINDIVAIIVKDENEKSSFLKITDLPYNLDQVKSKLHTAKSFDEHT